MARTSNILTAIDLGAGSGRIVAAELSNNNLTFHEIARFPTQTLMQNNLLHWDINFIEKSIRDGLAILEDKGSVLSIGIDSWGVDFALLDNQDSLIEIPRSYRNEHTRSVVKATLDLLDETKLYERTGIQTQHFNSIFQLVAWQNSEPEIFLKAQRFAMIPDVLAYRLGAPLVNEVTNASTTQFLNAKTRDWDVETLKILNLPQRLFRMPVMPGTVLSPSVVIGNLHPAFVAPATHDTGSAIAAVPLIDDKSAYIATGTWCLIGIESKTVETSEAARVANFTNEAGVDGTYRFLKNCMGLWLLQQLKDSWTGEVNYSAMVKAADGESAFQALIDADDPSFFHPESMKRAIESYWVKTNQNVPKNLGVYVRCCIESLVLVFLKTLDQIEKIKGLKLERIHIVGGGCQNSLLCQLTADATGLPVLAGPIEGSALGNILLQARALGLVSNQNEARKLIARSFPLKEYKPQKTQDLWFKARARLKDYEEMISPKRSDL